MSYHSGNPYIGVNFGVKTTEEEENTAGVVKDKFYQWNESNDYYVSCDCDKDNVRSGRWAFAADSPLVYLGDNWYKINDYLAAKVLLQVKGSSPTAVPFENVGTGADTRWHICDPGGQRLGGQGLAVIAVAFPENIAAVRWFGRHSSYGAGAII